MKASGGPHVLSRAADLPCSPAELLRVPNPLEHMVGQLQRSSASRRGGAAPSARSTESCHKVAVAWRRFEALRLQKGSPVSAAASRPYARAPSSAAKVCNGSQADIRLNVRNGWKPDLERRLVVPRRALRGAAAYDVASDHYHHAGADHDHREPHRIAHRSAAFEAASQKLEDDIAPHKEREDQSN